MLKILFYAYYCRIMTSRTIWKNVINRCDFIFLAAGQVPNFRRINSFRLRHLENLPNLFAQIVMLCKELDMIGARHYQLPVGKKNLFIIVKTIPLLINIIRSENIDIVHARSRVPAWIAFFACRFTDTKFVTTAHGYYRNRFTIS